MHNILGEYFIFDGVLKSPGVLTDHISIGLLITSQRVRYARFSNLDVFVLYFTLITLHLQCIALQKKCPSDNRTGAQLYRAGKQLLALDTLLQ